MQNNTNSNGRGDAQEATPAFNPVENRRRRLADNHKRVLLIVDAVVASGHCITDDYDDWLRVGFALQSELGEMGREPFRRLSAMSAKYPGDEECNKKYDSFMRSSRMGVTIGTLFHMAKEMAGISCDICDIVTSPPSHEKKSNSSNSLIINDGKKMSQADVTMSQCHNVTNATNGTVLEEMEQDCDTISDFVTNVKLCTFSDKIDISAWPPLLRPIVEQMDSPEGADKMLLGSLTVISSLIPKYYGLYDGRKLFPPLYLIVFGSAASGKGELNACRNIYGPVKQEMIRAYNAQRDEYQRLHSQWDALGHDKATRATRGAEPQPPQYHSPVIPANSSSSAFFSELQNNGGWGLMFETEIDGLAQMLGTDYGDYSTQLRSAFHHEPVTMNRKTDNLHIEIAQPRLAVCLTGTPSQLSRLFPSMENGLGSRFCFYRLQGNKGWHDVFRPQANHLEEITTTLGNQVYDIYSQLRQLPDQGVQFVLTPGQKTRFNEFFTSLLSEQTGMMGDDITSFVFRMGVNVFRIAMLLSLLRRHSDCLLAERMFPEGDQTLVCQDVDFETSLTIIDTLVSHTAHVVTTLVPGDKRAAKDRKTNVVQAMTSREKAFLKALPDEFVTSDIQTIAEAMCICKRTAYRFLQGFVDERHIVVRVRVGKYRKLNNDKEEKG